MAKRKLVSFWAKKPVNKKICFKAGGKKVCFVAKVPQKVKIKFRARR